VVVLAPTGVAAINVGGQTIHSFFKLSFGFQGFASPSTLRNKSGLKKLDAIIIDEISMVRADILDMIDKTLQYNLGNYEPFGGIQMIFFGDLQQLPPVVRDDEKPLFKEKYKGEYFFFAPGYKKARFTTITLSTIFRQNDNTFITLLDHVRNGTVTGEDLDLLNERVAKSSTKVPDGSITLTTHNSTADKVNAFRLQKLSDISQVFHGTIQGDFKENDLPAPSILELKVGAQVMFIKNDTDSSKRFVNGSIGEVVRLQSTSVTVQIDGQTIIVDKEKWENKRYEFDARSGEWDQKTIGSYEQYPLKLAWAITIHKAQGKTFDHVIIDLASGAFAHGQTYVALSRARTLDGVFLVRPVTSRDIIIDKQVLQFHSSEDSIELDTEIDF
jgi:ATP-dependent DNA helicase PIF1